MLKVSLVVVVMLMIGRQLGESYLLKSVDLIDEEKPASLTSETHLKPSNVQKKVMAQEKEPKNHRMSENDSYNESTNRILLEDSFADRFKGYLSSADFMSIPKLSKAQTIIQYMPIHPIKTALHDIDNKELASENKWSIAFNQQPEEAINNIITRVPYNVNQTPSEAPVSFDDDDNHSRRDAVSGHWKGETKKMTPSLVEAQKALQKSLRLQDKLTLLLNQAKSLKQAVVNGEFGNNSIERRDSNEDTRKSFYEYQLPPTPRMEPPPVVEGNKFVEVDNPNYRRLYVSPHLSVPSRSAYRDHSIASLSPPPYGQPLPVETSGVGRRLIKSSGKEREGEAGEGDEYKWHRFYRQQHPIAPSDLDYSIGAKSKYPAILRPRVQEEYTTDYQEPLGEGLKVGRLRGGEGQLSGRKWFLEDHSSAAQPWLDGPSSDSDYDYAPAYEDLVYPRQLGAGAESAGWRKGANKLISRQPAGLVADRFPAGVAPERGSLSATRGRLSDARHLYSGGSSGRQTISSLPAAAAYDAEYQQQSAAATRDLPGWSEVAAYDRALDLGGLETNPAHQQVVHVISSSEPTTGDKIKGHGKYLWPIVGGGLTILVSFLIISNVLLSIPLLAMGASSLFNSQQQGAFQSQQLVPVYNLSQLIGGGGGGGGGRTSSSSGSSSSSSRNRRSVVEEPLVGGADRRAERAAAVRAELESRVERLIDQLVAAGASGAASAAALANPRLLLLGDRGIGKLGQVLKAAYCRRSKIKRQPLVFN